MKKLKNQMKIKGMLFVLVRLLFVYMKNSPLFIKENMGPPLLLTYCGLTQTFSMGRLTNDTCLIEHLYKLKQRYMETTIPPTKVAFQVGADSAGVDIPPIKDG